MSSARIRSLRALIRVRKKEVDEARAGMARALAAESAALAELERQLTQIELERDEAEGDAGRESFRLWLPIAQENVARAEQVVRKTRTDSMRVREELIQANAAFKAAQTLLDRREEEERALLARREQAELDDLARRARRFFP
ncbi:flagellar FliJ family protein [Acetobacter fabarum]|uniref:flagellar FliJ family protein n=1 Tax=Acetobacter fabarum TaxID=483199 RepID=UPI00312B5245